MCKNAAIYIRVIRCENGNKQQNLTIFWITYKQELNSLQRTPQKAMESQNGLIERF